MNPCYLIWLELYAPSTGLRCHHPLPQHGIRKNDLALLLVLGLTKKVAANL